MATVKFQYEGKTYELPDMATIKPGVIRKARKGESDVDRTFLLIELALGEDSETLAALDELDADEFNRVITEWTQGAPVGESSGSSE